MAKKNTLKTKLIETRRKITLFVYGRPRDWEYVVVTYWKELRVITWQQLFPFHDGSLQEDIPVVLSKYAELEIAVKYIQNCIECAKHCEDYDWDSFIESM